MSTAIYCLKFFFLENNVLPKHKKTHVAILEFVLYPFALKNGFVLSFTCCNWSPIKSYGHLWYLNPEAAAFSFFDSNIPLPMKIKMVDSLKIQDENENITKRYITPMNNLNIAKKFTHFWFYQQFIDEMFWKV